MAKSKASNMTKPKKQGVRDPGGLTNKASVAAHPDAGSGDTARSPGSEDQRIGEGFPGAGSEMRAHMGGNMEGYVSNA